MGIQVKLTTRYASYLQKVADNLDKVAEKALVEAATIVETRVRSNLNQVIGSNTKTPSQSTGKLAGALGKSPVLLAPKIDGWDIKVGFSEPREDDYEKLKASRFRANAVRATASYNYFSRKAKKEAGLRVRNYSYYTTTNAMIANVLEHGKKGQAAKPFMKPAIAATRAKARERLSQVFNAGIEKIMGGNLNA